MSVIKGVLSPIFDINFPYILYFPSVTMIHHIGKWYIPIKKTPLNLYDIPYLHMNI